MILVDTSVWIDHLRQGVPRLARLLEEGRILCHPFVIGELSLGSLRGRANVLALLESLPQAAIAAHQEVLALVEEQRLAGSGLGWVDVHLLCAAALDGARLWTLDRRLASAAARLGFAM